MKRLMEFNKSTSLSIFFFILFYFLKHCYGLLPNMIGIIFRPIIRMPLMHIVSHMDVCTRI